jgi:hypothetical protein
MPVDILGFSVVGDVLSFLGKAFAAWRYLMSPKYRRRVHARWQSESQLEIAGDISSAVVGGVLFILLLWVAISLFAA